MYVKPQRMRIHTVNSTIVTECIVSLLPLNQGALPFFLLKCVDLTCLNELESVKQKKKMLEQVTATVSHELLTPIRSIVAFAKILLA